MLQTASYARRSIWLIHFETVTFGCLDNVCILSQLLINFITHTCCAFSKRMPIGCQMSSRYTQNKDTYTHIHSVAKERIVCFVEYLLIAFVVISLRSEHIMYVTNAYLVHWNSNEHHSHCATVCEYMCSCYVRKYKRFVRENGPTHSVASIIMDTTKAVEEKIAAHIIIIIDSTHKTKEYM